MLEKLDGRQDIIPLSEYRIDLHQGIIRRARYYLGVPYAVGGRSYVAIDCCGFIRGLLESIGARFEPRDNLWEMILQLTPVSDPKPGDLVLFGAAKPFVVGIVANDRTAIVCARDSTVQEMPIKLYQRNWRRLWRKEANNAVTYYCLLKGCNHGGNPSRYSRLFPLLSKSK